jgi:hypothetical protein
MENVYSEQLKELMGLIVRGEPKPKILTRAKEIKVQLSTAWTELQRVISLLDGMVNQYAPDKDWPMGFWLPSPKVEQPSFVFRTGVPMMPPRRITLITSPEHIAEVARRVAASDGIVETDKIIKQLRTEGEQRPVRDLAIGIGNTLARRGWTRIGTGLYQLSESEKSEEEIVETKRLPGT